MTKAEKAMYKDTKPVAIYPLSTWSKYAYEVLEIDYDITDTVVWRYMDTIHKSKIYYTTGESGSYFIAYGKRVYFKDCMCI